MYLSGYLKQHQAEYYRRLSIIRTEGDWESWVAFFLEGVATACSDAERSIIAIASLIAAGRRRLLEAPKAGPASYRLFEMLPMIGTTSSCCRGNYAGTRAGLHRSETADRGLIPAVSRPSHGLVAVTGH